MSEHYIEKCICGFVIRQCRCAGEKIVRIVPCDHPQTPPPDAQAMTRGLAIRIFTDCFNGPREIDPEWSREVDKVARASQVLKDAFDRHDAAQRETIRRLEEKLSSSRQEVDRAVYDYCVMKEKKDDLQARLTASEREVRHRMWTLHYSRMQHVPYGDDGRLDCNSCGRDYVATPMDELVQWEMLDASKLVTASEAKRKWTTARPTVAGWYWWRKGPGYSNDMAAIFYDEPHSEWEARFLGLKGGKIGTLPVNVCDGEWQGPLTPGEE